MVDKRGACVKQCNRCNLRYAQLNARCPNCGSPEFSLGVDGDKLDRLLKREVKFRRNKVFIEIPDDLTDREKEEFAKEWIKRHVKVMSDGSLTIAGKVIKPEVDP